MRSCRAPLVMRLARTALFPLVLAPLVVAASEVPAARERLVGHPRSRFPLGLHLEGELEPPIPAAARTAVADWNRVASQALGVPAFRWSDEAAGADVVIRMTPDLPERLFGETWLDADEQGVLRVPIRIALSRPVARGQTPVERLAYQVIAHELGHALGLPHANEPRSLMCCDRGSLNFEDPAVRDAYIQARREPDVGSVTAQLTAHYRQLWAR